MFIQLINSKQKEPFTSHLQKTILYKKMLGEIVDLVVLLLSFVCSSIYCN